MSQDIDATASGGLVLVTGAASVLGTAIAIAFAKEGHDLVLHDYVALENAETAVRDANANISITSVSGDILNPAFIGNLFDALGGRRIQVLAHAGSVESSRKDSQHIFETNFTAVKKLVETLTPRMENGGVIILIASLGGTLIKNMLVDFGVKRHARGSWSPTVWLLGKTQYTSYAIAKRCIQLYVKRKAAELSPFGVRIVSISPGLVGTSETEARSEHSERTAFLGHAPINRFGRPEEVASAATFLASPGASYITGTDLAVDGGLASQRWKATKSTATSLVSSRLDKLQQKNAARIRTAHMNAQAPANRTNSEPAGEDAVGPSQSQEEGTAEVLRTNTGLLPNSSIRSNFGTIRSRLAKIQKEGFGGALTGQPASAPETTTETAPTEGTATEAAEKPSEPAATNQEPDQDEQTAPVAVDDSTAESAVAGGVTAEGAIDEGQSAGKEPAISNDQIAQAGGLKSAIGGLRTRLVKIQQESVTRATEAHKSAASKADDKNDTGLKSVVGTVRAKLHKVQQNGIERIKKPQEIQADTANNGDVAGVQSLKSPVGSFREKLKALQEKNAARATSYSTNRAQKTPGGIFQPVAGATGGVQPTITEVKV